MALRFHPELCKALLMMTTRTGICEKMGRVVSSKDAALSQKIQKKMIFQNSHFLLNKIKFSQFSIWSITNLISLKLKILLEINQKIAVLKSYIIIPIFDGFLAIPWKPLIIKDLQKDAKNLKIFFYLRKTLDL